jgi:esterase/lipase
MRGGHIIENVFQYLQECGNVTTKKINKIRAEQSNKKKYKQSIAKYVWKNA